MGSEWKPASTMLETAPKHGEYFLVYRVDGKRIGDFAISPNWIGIARYVPSDKWPGWKLETTYQFVGNPTHWMEIPPPPGELT